MSISIVTFAQLGKEKNLKTPNITPVIDKLNKEKQLKKVICYRSKDFYFKNTFTALPRGVLWPIKGVEKCVNRSLLDVKEKTFDMVASILLSKSDTVVFHPMEFKKSAHAAKKQGATTIGIATKAHPEFDDNIQREEYENLGLSIKEAPTHRGVKHSTKHIDYIISSQFAKETYVEYGFPEQNIIEARNNINLDRFLQEEKPEPSKFRVLYIANTTPLKGLHYLLEAWEGLDLNKSELVLLGGMKVPEKLEKEYLKQIESDPTIKWEGYIDNPAPYYKKSSVFVLPSLTESFARVTLEAMASKLPVITTENSGKIINSEKDGFIVPIRDPKAIKEKIKFFYNNPKKRRKMGKNAQKTLLQKRTITDGVLDIYNNKIN